MNETPVQTLRRVARRAMSEVGLSPDFSAEAQHQLQKLTAPARDEVEDLRALLWCSVDNDDSRDLDQLSVCEELEGGAVRILESKANDWSASTFAIDDWQVPTVVTPTKDGTMTLPSALDMVLAPREFLAYRIVATPDRSRAPVRPRPEWCRPLRRASSSRRRRTPRSTRSSPRSGTSSERRGAQGSTDRAPAPPALP